MSGARRAAGYSTRATGGRLDNFGVGREIHTAPMSSQKPQKAAPSPRALIEDVEPRILYSADTGVLAYAPPAQADEVQLQTAQPLADQQQTQHRVNRLVVLDDSLPDLSLLVDDLEQQRDQGESIHILMIDADADGLSQVTEFLQSGQEQFTELHIISHGDDAQFELGNVTVNESLVRARANEFAQWDASLTAGADLLIYGCDFSASVQGESLAYNLSVLTGSDVASSVDDTGHVSLGANWTLESATGSVQAAQLFSNNVTNNWLHELTVVPGPYEGNSGNVQIDTPGSGDPTLDGNAGNRQVDSNGTITVVVWELNNEVYFRVMDADDPSTGTPIAVENDPTTTAQRWAPAVAVAADGTFMVVWTSADQNGSGGGTSGVYGQFFDSTGTPITRPADAYDERGGGEYRNPYEFRLNDHVPPNGQHTEDYDQLHPSVVATPAGGFFVSWTSSEEVVPSVNIDQVRLSRYFADLSHDSVVEAVEVNSVPNLNQNHAVLAVNPVSGDLYMASEVLTLGGDTVQLYSVDPDTGLSTGVLLNLDPTGGENAQGPRLDVNASGQWVLAARWVNAAETHYFHSDAAGNSLGFLSDSINADVAIRDNGNAIIATQIDNLWDASSSQDIAIREVLPTGESSTVIAPHSHTSGIQQNVGLIVNGNTATVIWDGENAADTDAIMIHNMAIVDPSADLSADAAITTESGAQINVDVQLSAPPSGTVTVTATVGDSTEAQIVGSADVSFDLNNWDTAQTIVIEGVADGIVDSNVNYDVDFSFAATAGLFQFAPTQTLSFANQNIDVPAVSDSDTAPNQVAEDAAATATIGLTASANVPGTTFQINGASPANAIFSIDPNTGVVTVTDSTALDAESNLPNPATITIPVIATSGGWNQVQNFVVSINDVNDNTPSITGPVSVSITEGVIGTLAPAMSATDGDLSPTTLTWSLSAPAPYDTGFVSIDSSTGVITVDTAFDFEDATLTNPLPLTVEVSDGVNTTSTTVNLIIVDTNDSSPTIAASQVFSVSEGAVNATLVGITGTSDADSSGVNPTPTFSLIGTTSGGVGVPAPFEVTATGVIRVVDSTQLDIDIFATYELQVQVDDGVNPATSGPVTINVTDVNYPPVGANNSVVTTEDTQFIFGVSDIPFTDPDAGNTLGSIRIVSVPVNGQLTVGGVLLDGSNTSLTTPYSVTLAQINAMELRFLPAQDLTITQSFDYYVVDQSGTVATATHSMQVTVSAGNDAPRFPDGLVSVATAPENQTFTGAVNVFDIDDPISSLTYQILSGPDTGFVSVDLAGDITIVAQDYENPLDQGANNGYEFTVRVTDPAGAYSDQSWTVNITDEADALNFDSIAPTTASEDASLIVAPALSLTDELTSASLTVALDSSEAKISLATTNGLTFLAGDGMMDVAMTFSGSLTDVNAAMGSLALDAPENFNGTISVNAAVSDPLGRTDVTTLAVNVTPVNDLPVVDGSKQISLEAGSVTPVTTAIITTSDVEDTDSNLVFTLVSSPESGQLLLSGVGLLPGDTFTQQQLADGALSYESLVGTNLIEQLIFQVTDRDGGVTTEQIDIETTSGSVVLAPSDGDILSSESQTSEADEQIDSSSPVISTPSDNGSSSTNQAVSAALVSPDADSESSTRDVGREETRAKPQIILAYQIAYQNTDYQGYRVSELQTDYESASNSNLFVQSVRNFSTKFEVDDFRQSMRALEESIGFRVQLDRQFVASTAVVSTGMSIGYVLWLMRGGALLSSIIASMPAWRSIDPLPVLASLDSADDGQAEDDSLEAMLEKSSPSASAETEAKVAEETE